MKRTDAPGGSKVLKPGPGETRAGRDFVSDAGRKRKFSTKKPLKL